MKYSEIDEEVKKSLKRDWIITNGIGGFCSQSALGCNTRKYHGLLDYWLHHSHHQQEDF